MTNSVMKKGWIIALICIILFFLPVFQASSRDLDERDDVSRLIPDGGPDLVLQSFGFKGSYGDHGYEIVAYAIILNNGEEQSDGPVDFVYSLQRLLSKKTVANSTFLVSSDGLLPGESVYLELNHVKYLPRFGAFTLTGEVNPKRTINETTFQNNGVTRISFSVFGIWFPLDSQ